MKDVGKFNGHLVYFTVIWYILRPFGIFCVHFGTFFPVLVCCKKRNLATRIGITRFSFHRIEWDVATLWKTASIKIRTSLKRLLWKFYCPTYVLTMFGEIQLCKTLFVNRMHALFFCLSDEAWNLRCGKKFLSVLFFPPKFHKKTEKELFRILL
jgi:hypothetical protein